MRSIKFKAWDSRNECWLFDGNAMDLQYSGESGAMMFDNDANMTPRDSLAWVQFTGLHDKSGKEIYEGDVVIWDDNSNGRYWRVAEVLINPDLYFKCFDSPAFTNSSAHGHKFHYGNFIYKNTEDHLEVIGNIYEHGDLLND